MMDYDRYINDIEFEKYLENKQLEASYDKFIRSNTFNHYSDESFINYFEKESEEEEYEKLY